VLDADGSTNYGCALAGFVGGYIGFGDSKGLSGSVNNQIVLYLFARGIYGLLVGGVRRQLIPQVFNVRSETGFRIFAGFSLALILYLTEYEPDTLSPSFMSTMNFLYYDRLTTSQLFFLSLAVVLRFTLFSRAFFHQ